MGGGYCPGQTPGRFQLPPVPLFPSEWCLAYPGSRILRPSRGPARLFDCLAMLRLCSRSGNGFFILCSLAYLWQRASVGEGSCGLSEPNSRRLPRNEATAKSL
jgi:hypothetical protein